MGQKVARATLLQHARVPGKLECFPPFLPTLDSLSFWLSFSVDVVESLSCWQHFSAGILCLVCLPLFLYFCERSVQLFIYLHSLQSHYVYLFYFVCICMCVSMLWCACGGERTSCRSDISSSHVVTGNQTPAIILGGKTFSWWAILQILMLLFLSHLIVGVIFFILASFLSDRLIACAIHGFWLIYLYSW